MFMNRAFIHARPVWLANREKEMNVRAIFRRVMTVEKAGRAVLKLATSGIYNVFLNGEFIAYGPARAGRGHFRMDELPLNMIQGENVLVIEVAGYYANNFYLMMQPSFLQAEVSMGGVIRCATGWKEDFEAREDDCSIQRVQRYSFQRPMIEAYRMEPGYDAYRYDANAAFQPQPQALQAGGQTIARGTPYPEYEVMPAKPIFSGAVEPDAISEGIHRDRSYFADEKLRGYAPEERELSVTDETQKMRFEVDSASELEGEIRRNGYRMYELERIATGMMAMEVRAEQDVELYCIFDEVLRDGDILLTRSSCANTIKFTLKKGSYRLKAFEVYTMKFIKLVAVGGAVQVDNLRVIEYKHPPVDYLPNMIADDEELDAIFRAARESFLQNAVDLYTDCPSRERAGWLCDSFFTGRVEKVLTGSSEVERAFLENFLHEDKYEFLPEGMLPMCYPSDHNDGSFIANWALWLVLELAEYRGRSGDEGMIRAYRDKIYALMGYMAGLENADGLLENVPGWVFVEWSKANELVQDVNYPSNMLYSAALRAAGSLYNDSAFLEKAEKIKEEVLKQSFDGSYFVDNAVRGEDGKLHLSGERTEVCQYYAFFCGVATPESHGELFKTLVRDFGPERHQINRHPEIYFANAFIGNYLRLDILMRYGYRDAVLKNIRGYFLNMARKTGTLWENDGDYASCNHGFASHVIYWLDQLDTAQM
jgi:alpha-L-rhamnosidase